MRHGQRLFIHVHLFTTGHGHTVFAARATAPVPYTIAQDRRKSNE